MEKEIEFKDIRVGDTIRREWVQRKAKWTCEGEVTAVQADDLCVEVEGASSWCHTGGRTYILVNRPTPKLPTEPGSLIKVTKLNGKSSEWLARLGGDEWWDLFALTGENNGGWASPDEIEEWHHVEIFEVTP